MRGEIKNKKNITTTTETKDAGWIGCKCWALGLVDCDKPSEKTYK